MKLIESSLSTLSEESRAQYSEQVIIVSWGSSNLSLGPLNDDQFGRIGSVRLYLRDFLLRNQNSYFVFKFLMSKLH